MNILKPLKLLLPALIPSWNFFDTISPSPRIEYSLLSSENEKSLNWIEFRPKPSHISLNNMFKRLFWNPKWNESLFLTSCAERILENHTLHSENEILRRIERDLVLRKEQATETHLQFRLLFIQRVGIELKTEILFNSRIHNLSSERKDES